MHSLLLLSTCCPPTTAQNSTQRTESRSDGNGLGCDHLGYTERNCNGTKYMEKVPVNNESYLYDSKKELMIFIEC